MDVKRPGRPSAVYYGWYMVVALSLSATISYGILSYSFTVFIEPMRRELGWSVAFLAGAYSAGLLVAGFVAIPVGRWLDAHGARGVMSAGSVLACLMLLAWSQVSSPWAFYLIWVGLGASMAAVLYEPAFAVLAVWFRRDRGKALTVLTFLGGFASVLFIPLAGYLVEAHGWRTALVILAGIEALTLPLHALVLRRNPADLGLEPDGARSATPLPPPPRRVPSTADLNRVFSGASFRLLALAFSLSTFVIAAQGVHLVPLLVAAGHEPAFAAAVGGAIGLVALPGRLVLTPLGDMLPRRLVTAGILASQSLGFLVLLAGAANGPVLWLFIVLYSAGFGAVTPARAALLADYYGGAQYARVSARMSLLNSLARALAPLSTGLLVTWSGGNYRPLVLVLGVLAGAGAATIALARPPTDVQNSV